MRRIGEATDEDDRQVVLIGSLSAFEAWRDLTSDPSWDAIDAGFAVFLAADASTVETDLIAELARWLIDRGMFSFSAWGPDCERVHDIVDEVDVDTGGDSIVMTTWHADEPLNEALMSLWWAFPSDGKADGPYRIVLTVASDEWRAAASRLAKHHLVTMAGSP